MCSSDLLDDGGNGRFDAGESGTVLLHVANTGSATAWSTEAALGTPSGPATLTLAQSALGDVAPGSTATLEIAVTIAGTAEAGDLLTPSATVTTGPYGTTGGCTLELALTVEDWETGGAGFPWASAGLAPWFITDDEVYEGTHSLRSGDIGDGLLHPPGVGRCGCTLARRNVPHRHGPRPQLRWRRRRASWHPCRGSGGVGPRAGYDAG